MEVAAAAEKNNNSNEVPAAVSNEVSSATADTQKDGDNEVIYYLDEPPHAIGEKRQSLVIFYRFSSSSKFQHD